MFTYLKAWFSMLYRMFFPKTKPIIRPAEWDPMIMDDTPIFSPKTKTIEIDYEPITGSLSYRKRRLASNRRLSGFGYNNYSTDQFC